MPATTRLPPFAVLSAVIVMTCAFAQVAAPQTAPAASWTPEVSAAIGLGHVFRYEDQTFGDRPNLSGGLAIHHRSGLGVEIEANRTLGLSPAPAPCGVSIDGVPAACVGTAHDGVRAATSASLTVHYRFHARRHQPYLVAGLGVLRTRSVWSRTDVHGAQAVQSEQVVTDTGIGPDLGAGVRFVVTPRLSISPEIRWLEGSARSRLNLAVTRLAVRAAYSW